MTAPQAQCSVNTTTSRSFVKLPSIKDYNIQAKATTRDDGLLRAVYAQAVQMRDAGASQQQANDYIVRTLRSYDVDPGILRQVQQAAAASRTA